MTRQTCRVTIVIAVLVGLAAAPRAWAAPPLVLATDTADAGLRVWWREGDLLVAPPAGDDRPGMRPLVGTAPVNLPDAMSGWLPLGETCTDAPTADFVLDGRPARVVSEGDWTRPAVKVLVEDRVVAQAQLGRPARICEVAAGQADNIPGLEVLVAWRLSEDASDVRGLTVFRIPDSAR